MQHEKSIFLIANVIFHCNHIATLRIKHFLSSNIWCIKNIDKYYVYDGLDDIYAGVVLEMRIPVPDTEVDISANMQKKSL